MQDLAYRSLQLDSAYTPFCQVLLLSLSLYFYKMELGDVSICLFEHPDITIRDDPDLILRVLRKLLQRSRDPPMVVPTVLVYEWLDGALHAFAIKRVGEKLLHESCINRRLTSSLSRISRFFDFK